MRPSSQREEPTFEEIREALMDKKTPFPATMIYFFSDITREDLRRLENVWPKVTTQRRRGLLEDMESMAEADTLLYFDDLAVMALEDQDPVARATAIRLLWQSQDEKLVPKLLKRLKDDPETIVRAAAATALGTFVYYGECDEISEGSHQEIVAILHRVYLSSDEPLVRRRALEALGYSSHPDVPGFIQQAYAMNQDEWLQSALFAMGRTYDNQRWSRPVLECIDHPDSLVQYEAVRAAGKLGLDAAREPLFDLLAEGTNDEDLYFAAIWSLTEIGGDGVRRLITYILEEADDIEEIQFLEEALANLNFTEEVNRFDMMAFDSFGPDEFDEWEDAGDEDARDFEEDDAD